MPVSTGTRLVKLPERLIKFNGLFQLISLQPRIVTGYALRVRELLTIHIVEEPRPVSCWLRNVLEVTN